jgi:cytochrome c biogenesis DsbD-like protein
MKLFLPAFLLLLFAGHVNAQILNPVSWSYSSKKIGDKIYELHITAFIQDKWHVYSQDAGDGPIPTSFVFSLNPLITLYGKVKEVGTLQKIFDKNFNSTLKYYEQKVDFVQVIKLRSTIKTIAKGTLTYMVCSDRQCLPPKDIPFSINVGGK